ncbi:MAG TPA: hypothetical protein VHZ76_06690 [Gammaproteobacteria bacterium]|nr:hypothetical protein [Gammaproteobacteria bacterium]
MERTATRSRNSRHNNHDLHGDLAKVKAALTNAGWDIRGHAEGVLDDYLTEIREKSDAVKENVVAYTTKKPLKTLGIVLLAGLAIGFLLRK